LSDFAETDMASNDVGENNFMKKTHKDEYEICEVTSEYQHRSLLPVNDSLTALKRKRSRNGLLEVTNKIIKKQKLKDNSSVEKTLKNNCDDESPRSYQDDNQVYPNSSRDYSERCNDKLYSWNRKYQALDLRMKRLSKEIEKYMQKTLRSKSKKEKINSLLSGHTPVPEKHIPTTISHLNLSGININELCIEFLKDPKSCEPSNLYSDMDVSRVSVNNASIEPITIHDPTTEILASLNSHAPIPYKIYPITLLPPNYSGFKINKIHSGNFKDPRLGTFSKLYSGINVSGVPEYSPLAEPIPFHKSETKIKGSCDSHAPIQYKLIQISIPPPDYSGFKINKLCTEIMKDPRLYNPSNLYRGIEVSGLSEDKPPIEPATEEEEEQINE
jgi:hypothetical protein